MQKRLFVAITLPEEAERILSYEADAISAELPADIGLRLASRHKLHFTIIFLGSQEGDQVSRIVQSMKKVVSQIKPFGVKITRTGYAPEGDRKRMVWAYGESEGMAELKKKMEEVFAADGIWIPRSTESFIPHITLARFEPREISDLPEIAEELDIKFESASAELVESEESKESNEHEYHEVASVNFGQRPENY